MSMNSYQSLVRKSSYYFASFMLLAIVAFWPKYFSSILANQPLLIHAHGISMTLWCLSLIVQPYLIKTKRLKIHRWVGTASYLLVPFFIISTLLLVHAILSPAIRLTNGHYYFFTLVFNALVAFAILYGLAIYHRKNSGKHARYMICTVFTMITPVTDRLISRYFRFIIDFVPRIDQIPVVPVAGFLIADIILLGLILYDWRYSKSNYSFLVAWSVLLIYHVSVLTFYQFGFWQVFTQWFLSR